MEAPPTIVAGASCSRRPLVEQRPDMEIRPTTVPVPETRVQQTATTAATKQPLTVLAMAILWLTATGVVQLHGLLAAGDAKRLPGEGRSVEVGGAAESLANGLDTPEP